MSEIEVAGLVLAVIPLFISAAEHYRDGLDAVDKIWQKERILQQYLEELETQQSYLIMGLQGLLVEVDLDYKIKESLVGNTATDLNESTLAYSEAWEQPHVRQKLEQRFRGGYKPFVFLMQRLTQTLLRQIKKHPYLPSDKKVGSSILSWLQSLELEALNRTSHQQVVLRSCMGFIRRLEKKHHCPQRSYGISSSLRGGAQSEIKCYKTSDDTTMIFCCFSKESKPASHITERNRYTEPMQAFMSEIRPNGFIRSYQVTITASVVLGMRSSFAFDEPMEIVDLMMSCALRLYSITRH